MLEAVFSTEVESVEDGNESKVDAEAFCCCSGVRDAEVEGGCGMGIVDGREDEE